MWPKRIPIANRLEALLGTYSSNYRRLPGIDDPHARATLALQMVASLRRLEYTNIVSSRGISPERADPSSPLFDPERAAIIHARAGRIDEAFWLIFLATHFGKHLDHGWRRVRDVYSGLGDGVWTWERVSANPSAFRSWLRMNASRIGGAFGNHRKYESLKADSPSGTAAAIESYIEWVGPRRSHQKLVADLVQQSGNHPNQIFDGFYKSMNVKRFGRLGKFDFLAMIGRLGLAPITPGSAYLKGATGPLRGAKLLFFGDPEVAAEEKVLDIWLQELDEVLQVGMQVMEDSLCNWQKSPSKFIHFRG